jgi:hypothetical protein
MFNKVQLLFIAAIPLLSLGCRSTQGLKSLDRSSELQIFGGEPVGSGQFEAKQTLAFMKPIKSDDTSKYRIKCSASRIGPNLLLTAAHCLDRPLRGYRLAYGPAIADDKDSSSAIEAASLNHDLKILALIKHPRWQPRIDMSDKSDFSNDLGLIVFDGELPIEISPLASFVDFAEKEEDLYGQPKLIQAGYGVSSEQRNVEVKQLDALFSARMGVRRIEVDKHRLVYERWTAKTGLCSGDSGGPAYIQSAKLPALQLGVASLGAGNCQLSGGTITDVRYFRRWNQCSSDRAISLFRKKLSHLKDSRISSEEGDQSAADCAATSIEDYESSVVNARKECEKRPGRYYENESGECQIIDRNI